MTIADIIKVTQPKIYIILVKIFALDGPGRVVDLDTAETEELVNWRIRKLMSERKAVHL